MTVISTSDACVLKLLHSTSTSVRVFHVGSMSLRTPLASRSLSRCHRVSVRYRAEMSCSSDDMRYMQQALDLARKGLGMTQPNPAVGCVLVKDEQVVGCGYHPKAGLPHAEVYALRGAGAEAKGSTAYVTLEPCNHYGRTPPCSRALVDAEVKRVVVGVSDPNPLVGGRGIETLKNNGIEVDVGCLESECYEINKDFMRVMQRQPQS